MVVGDRQGMLRVYRYPADTLHIPETHRKQANSEQRRDNASQAQVNTLTDYNYFMLVNSIKMKGRYEPHYIILSIRFNEFALVCKQKWHFFGGPIE